MKNQKIIKSINEQANKGVFISKLKGSFKPYIIVAQTTVFGVPKVIAIVKCNSNFDTLEPFSLDIESSNLKIIIFERFNLNGLSSLVNWNVNWNVKIQIGYLLPCSVDTMDLTAFCRRHRHNVKIGPFTLYKLQFFSYSF